MSTPAEFEQADSVSREAAWIYERREPTEEDVIRIRKLLSEAAELYDAIVERLRGTDDAAACSYVIRAATMRIMFAVHGAERDEALPLMEQAEDACIAALKELDCRTHPAASFEGHFVLGYSLYKRGTALPVQDSGKLLTRAVTALDAAGHLARQTKDLHGAMRVRSVRAQLLLELFAGNRDLDLMEGIRNAQCALPYFRRQRENCPIEAPHLLNTLGNSCLKVSFRRETMIAMARDAYAYGLELVDREAFPRLARTLESNHRMSLALLENKDLALPTNEMALRFQRSTQNAIDAGDFDEALRQMWNSLRWSWTLDPKPNNFTASAHDIISTFHQRAGQLQEALRHSYCALLISVRFAEHPQVASFVNEQRRRCVDLMNAMGQGQRAEELLRESETGLARALEALAEAARTIDKDPEAALPLLEKALSFYPMHPTILFYRGVARMLRDELIPAFEDFNRSLEILPNSCETRVNRGVVAAKLGNDRQALADFDAALEIRPDDPNVVLNRAGCLARMGSPEKALPSLDRLLKLEPEEPRLLRMRSAVLQAMSERPAG